MSISSLLNTVSAVGNLANALGGGARTWAQSLQQASWNGVPFGVRGGEIKFGRRTAVHQYPLTEKNPVWVEDIGRGARRINMSGFLIENSLVYGGGAVIAQRKAMIAACEKKGPGQLVHPTLGKMTVSLIEASAGEQWDEGRVFEIRFVFIESGQRIYPSSVTSTTDATKFACTAADTAAASDFSAAVVNPLVSGAAVVSQAVATAQKMTGQIISLAANATSTIHLVSALAGTLSPSLASSLGRYAGGGLSGFMSGATLPSVQGVNNATATVQSVVALGAAARAGVATAGAALGSTASSLGFGL